MQARIFRLFQDGEPVDLDWLRESRGVRGELRLRVRLSGREAARDIHVASLEDETGRYIVPCLDQAKIVEIRGPWLCLVGVEIQPVNRGRKRVLANRFQQTWWCRVAG